MTMASDEEFMNIYVLSTIYSITVFNFTVVETRLRQTIENGCV